MRVIAGAMKGRRLESPKSPAVRPTSDKVRGAIFNILAPDMEGARVLDLFAGTGALGIEAFSRGAVSVVFVESDRRVAAALLLTLHAFKAGTSDVIAGDSLRTVERLAAEGRSFDVIFLDPPYGQGLAAAVVARIAASGLLANGGTLVAEHRKDDEMPGDEGTLVRLPQRRYGDTMLSLYEAAGSRA